MAAAVLAGWAALADTARTRAGVFVVLAVPSVLAVALLRALIVLRLSG